MLQFWPVHPFQSTEKMLSESNELVALMPASELLILIQHTDFDPDDLPRIWARLGVSPAMLSDADCFLDPAMVWHLLAAICYELNDECLGVLSHRVPVGSFELILAKAVQEPTLGRAISAFADAANLLWPDVEFKLTRRLDELHFCMRCETTQIPSHVIQMLLEISCVTFFCMFQWLSVDELPVKRIRISKDRLSDRINQLAALNCPVQFKGNGVDIIMSAEIAGTPTNKRHTSEWFKETYQILLAVLEKRTQSLRSMDLRIAVMHALRSGIDQQPLIATSLGMSVATLRRKLAQEGVSFGELRDQVFRESASSFMSSGESVEAVAEKMGYSDARSFRRAFQRLFDVAPSEFRHGLNEKCA